MKKCPVLSVQFELIVLHNLYPRMSLHPQPADSFPLSSVGSLSPTSLIFLCLHLVYWTHIQLLSKKENIGYNFFKILGNHSFLQMLKVLLHCFLFPVLLLRSLIPYWFLILCRWPAFNFSLWKHLELSLGSQCSSISKMC